MKKAAIFAVSVAAAASSSFVAFTSTSSVCRVSNDKVSDCSSVKEAAGSGSQRRGGKNDKFAPRFDGLRFIETLVTAHR